MQGYKDLGKQQRKQLKSLEEKIKKPFNKALKGGI